MNSFIAIAPVMPAPGAFRSFSRPLNFIAEFRRTLGRIAARLPQIRAAAGHAAADGRAMQPGTFTRLCDRKKFGMVGVRTASLSQLRGKPGTGIATKVRRFGAEKVQARPFVGDVERPGLNL